MVDGEPDSGLLRRNPVANRLAVRVGVNTSIMLGCALLLAGAALQLALP